MQSALLTGVKGTPIGLMLPEPVMLRMGDALELDDGSLVEVVIEAEPLVEVRGNDLTHLARLAWHLGDRHVPVQILANRLRLRRDAALETLLGNLGARLTAIEAPFDPEGGAYTPRPRIITTRITIIITTTIMIMITGQVTITTSNG